MRVNEVTVCSMTVRLANSFEQLLASQCTISFVKNDFVVAKHLHQFEKLKLANVGGGGNETA